MKAASLGAGAAHAAWRSALGALTRTGAPARLSVLIFHRVHRTPDPLFPDEPDAARFEDLCRWLAGTYHVLPLDEAVRRRAAGTLPPRALAITFDDGYADNHDVALPILQAHGLPATFFIATGYLESGRMWNDTVVEAVRRCQAGRLDAASLGIAGLSALDLSTTAHRRAAVHALLNSVKYLAPNDRALAVARLAEAVGAALPDDLMMRPSQVHALARAGMQIGAHTVSHPILARVDGDQALQEMRASKDTLQAIVGSPVTLFAYPNGKARRDYLPRDVELARRAGFEAAVSTNPGASVRGDGLDFELPRFTPWDSQRWRFALRLARNLFTPTIRA